MDRLQLPARSERTCDCGVKCYKMDETLPESTFHAQQLSNELLTTIRKYLTDEDCASLALSRAVKGFAAFFKSESLQKNHVAVNNRWFYLSPSSFKVHFKQHIHPDTVTILSLNHCYWLPSQLLYDAIVQMKALEEVSVRDTKVSLPMLADILKTCSKITKLDFSFRFEEEWENYGPKKALLDSLDHSFKKLKCLKILTCVQEVRDYRHDPWQLIMTLLTFCRDCVELCVEVCYTGDSKMEEISESLGLLPAWEIEYLAYQFRDQFNNDREHLQETVFTHLDWMKNLTSLVLIRSGDTGPVSEYILDPNQSLMVDDLLTWLFSSERAPRTLQHIWIDGFNFVPPYVSTHFSASSLVSHQTRGYRFGNEIANEPEPFSRFPNLAFVANLSRFAEKCSLFHLPDLKYVHGMYQCDTRDEPWLDKFIREHPNLKGLAVNYHIRHYGKEYVVPDNHEWKLPKLKVLNYSGFHITNETVDPLVEGCPNVEVLQLCKDVPGSPAEQFFLNRDIPAVNYSHDKETLSAIKFHNLTSLSLGYFDIGDGSYLLPIAKECRKLQRLDLVMNSFDSSWDPAKLTLNFDSFLPLITNLQDFRLMNDFKGNGSIILPLLESFLTHSPQLMRLALMDSSKSSPAVPLAAWNPPSDMPDSIVNFVLKMPHLTALCIVLTQLDSELIDEVNRRIEKEVIPSNPSLWFCFDSSRPNPSTSRVPFVHYFEMVSPAPTKAAPKIQLIQYLTSLLSALRLYHERDFLQR